MRALRILAPALAGATALLLVLPADTGAFTTLGTNLGVADERDVRVHNNFSDPTANDDQSFDPNFPGYFGAQRAIWKACVEWGSRLHGSGAGDPHQPAGLGSGGANFDVTWQGSALTIGAHDKIHSQISGGNGGVYAYCETPFTGFGWRIRYYQDPWIWEDGPGGLPGGHTDLQGIAAHEYGHALGLGHSSVSGATMVGSVSQSGSYFNRSIEGDDISGVRTIYGVASAAKPIIASIAAPTSGVVEILGSGFHATSNEVWLTRGTATGGAADPVRATGVPSTDAGTRITVGVPFGVGSGDILVKVPGTQHHTLSNAWPFDEELFACTWSNFCVAMPNSTGVGATMTVVGSTSIAANDFAINLSGLPIGTVGIFYTGNQQTPGTPFGNGVNCISGSVLRFGVMYADALGGFSYPINFGSYPGNQMSADGTPWYFQFWYRNPAGGGAGYNTSDGVCVVWCP